MFRTYSWRPPTFWDSPSIVRANRTSGNLNRVAVWRSPPFAFASGLANAQREARGSRWRYRQQLFVLRIVRILAQPCRHEHQVVVHFIAHADLAELARGNGS